MFLYFFFQGYYPDVRLGLKRILSESGTTTHSGVSDLIRSFGIINIATIPTDATITLGSGAYSTNEKRMSDYGSYRMNIVKTGYLRNQIDFVIDREKPYLIEKISLLPTPKYQKKINITDVYGLNDDIYIFKTASWLIWSGSTASGRVSYSWSLEHIGGSYFLTSTGVLTWERDNFQKASLDITNFVETCPHIEWRDVGFSCPETKSILTTGGKYMTGILDTRWDLISRSGSITEISGGNLGSSWKNPENRSLGSISLMEGILYYTISGSLIPMNKGEIAITTSLEQIIRAESQSDDTLILGTKWEKKYIIIRHTGDPLDRARMIELAESIDIEHIIFHSLSGNLILETPNSILFIYRGSTELRWLIDGDILSYSDTGVYYRKDGAIWWADWSEK
jgi:hypothetical protein